MDSRRLICGFAAIALIAVGSQVLFSQDDDALPEDSPLVSLPYPSGDTDVQEPAADGAAVLRERFVELARVQAGLMDAERLEQGIVQAETSIVELKAARKLAEARATLLSLVQEFPQSAAATVAQQMLAAGENQGEWEPRDSDFRGFETDDFNDFDDRRSFDRNANGLDRGSFDQRANGLEFYSAEPQDDTPAEFKESLDDFSPSSDKRKPTLDSPETDSDVTDDFGPARDSDPGVPLPHDDGVDKPQPELPDFLSK